MLAAKNTYIDSAYHTLRSISQDTQKRLEYEAREKAILDHNQMMFEAKQQGWEEGRKEGREEGEKNSTKRINQLNRLLIQDKRYSDLERSVNDQNFQCQLLKEYNI